MEPEVGVIWPTPGSQGLLTAPRSCKRQEGSSARTPRGSSALPAFEVRLLPSGPLRTRFCGSERPGSGSPRICCERFPSPTPCLPTGARFRPRVSWLCLHVKTSLSGGGEDTGPQVRLCDCPPPLTPLGPQFPYLREDGLALPAFGVG